MNKYIHVYMNIYIGIGQVQLNWFRNILDNSQKNNERCFVYIYTYVHIHNHIHIYE
jgi:hypothetical protein